LKSISYFSLPRHYKEVRISKLIAAQFSGSSPVCSVLLGLLVLADPPNRGNSKRSNDVGREVIKTLTISLHELSLSGTFICSLSLVVAVNRSLSFCGVATI